MGHLSSGTVDKVLDLILADLNQSLVEQATAESPIDRLTQEADKLDLALDSLQYHVETRTADIRRRRNLLLPISRLPLEVLLKIFQHVIETPEPTDILVLAGVSSSWFRTCLFEPRLWHHISNLAHVEYTRLRVKRSGNTPLHISCHKHPQGMAAEEEFLSIVAEHTDRWKTFSICSPHNGELSSNHLASKKFPMLEELELRSMDGYKDSLYSLKIQAPSLRSLIYEYSGYPLRFGVKLYSNLRSIEFLTRYDGTDLIKQCHRIFSSAPNLEHISITGHIFIASSSNDNHTKDAFNVQLRNLKTLKLLDLPWGTINTLLSSISTPPHQLPSFSVTAIPNFNPSSGGSLPIIGSNSILTTICASEWVTIKSEGVKDGNGKVDEDSDEEDYEDYEDSDDETKYDIGLLTITAGIGEGPTKKRLWYLELKCDGGTYVPSKTVEFFMKSGWFSQIRRMDVEGIQVFERKKLPWSNSSLQFLEVLRVRYASLEEDRIFHDSHMARLIETLSSPYSSDRKSWPCPQLRHVAFNSCKIEESYLEPFLKARCRKANSSQVSPNAPRRLELVQISRSYASSGRLAALAAKYNVDIRCGEEFEIDP